MGVLWCSRRRCAISALGPHGTPAHQGVLIWNFFFPFLRAIRAFSNCIFPQSDACSFIEVTPQQYASFAPFMRFCRRVASIRGLAALRINSAFQISGKCAESAKTTRKKKFEIRSYAWQPRLRWATMGSAKFFDVSCFWPAAG